MKANHNDMKTDKIAQKAVSNGSKLLKWKQITTRATDENGEEQLFPMAQSY